MRVALYRHASDVRGSADALAANLDLPLIPSSIVASTIDAGEYDFLLAYLDCRLTLQSLGSNSPGQICVDFSDTKLLYRAKSAIKSQNIAKAVGVKGDRRPTVLDATAGLGKDAYLLASLGCAVSMLERSPLVHALLSDGLSREGEYNGETRAVLARMHLRHGDFLAMQPSSEAFDVVYLDPMFPQRRKSAKVKRDMAMLQNLLGHQEDGEELLAHARKFARRRVVVKRAKLSPQLGSVKPDIEFKGSSSRYDVYLLD